jgi:hypothetical protein
MENSFSSSDQELSDIKTKCSIFFYITEDGTVMFEAGWNNKENEESNKVSLAYLLHGIKNTEMLENAMKTSVESYRDNGHQDYASDMQSILETFQKIQEEQKITNISKIKEQESSQQRPVIRPLQAK